MANTLLLLRHLTSAFRSYYVCTFQTETLDIYGGFYSGLLRIILKHN